MEHPPLLQTSFELSIPSEFGYEKIAREAVAAFARRLGFEGERLEDLKTALGEACINAIEHGNQRSSGLRVDVVCIVDDHALMIDVQDQGLKRYQQHNPAASIDDKLLGQAPLRGMGLMIIRELVDDSGFVDQPGEGNCFRLKLLTAALRSPAQPTTR